MSSKIDITKKSALQFFVLLSVVSLFADMTYEGARSITGPYLAILGANAAVVGFVSGFGEFIGYALRLVSGILADRTQKYWLITIIGYCCNLLAVPLLALAGHWWVAAILIVVERAGRAIRVPPRDAMLSHVGQKLGMGWIFGLHEAFDQFGAMVGPLLVAVVLYFKGSYQHSFALLLLPAIAALLFLFLSRWRYPKPLALEVQKNQIETTEMKSLFWLYLIGASFIAAGYADFPLIAYHFQKMMVLSPIWIAVFYALAMGVNTITTPIFGYLYDRFGFSILILVTLLTCIFAPLVFFGNFTTALIGVALWSIGISAHESLMRAVVANMVPMHKRASAYGIFNMGYGLCWFLGSCLMGILYDFSILSLVLFSMITQLLAVPLLYHVMRKMRLQTRKS